MKPSAVPREVRSIRPSNEGSDLKFSPTIEQSGSRDLAWFYLVGNFEDMFRFVFSTESQDDYLGTRTTYERQLPQLWLMFDTCAKKLK